jgi:DNA-binding transcriptional LysR family regulator
VDILPNEKVAEHTASLLNDLGFISLPIRHKKLVVREVLTERLILIAAPTHSLARKKALHPRDLQGHPIIMHEPGSALQKAMDDLIGRGEGNGSPYLEFSNNEAIKRAVAAGTGIALISERAAGEEVRTGRLVALRLSRPPMTRQFYMVHHRAKIMTPALSRLMEMVAQWAFDTNSHHGRRILSHEPQSAEDILHGR